MVAAQQLVEAPEAVESFVILPNVSWETYECLLADQQDVAGVRFTYDEKRLEIMVLSPRHEKTNRNLAQLVEILAEEMALNIERLGSTTFKQAERLKGFEPDSCYYIQNADAIAGKEKLDLKTDPPPDLVIEIDISSGSLNKQPIFAAAGVPEVWRYDGGKVTILRLEGDEYVKAEQSPAFRLLTSELVTTLLEESFQMKSLAWSRRVREWAREQLSK